MTQRNTRKKTIKKRIIIATEGSKTEPRYFDSLKAQYRLSNVKVLTRKSTRSSPKDVIKCLDKYKRDNGFNKGDEFWAVFDHDKRSEEELNNVAREAKKKNYRLADSNPCFELWLLLHHKPLNQFRRLETSGDNRACSRAESELEKLDQSYDKDNKGRLNTSKYISRITTAIQNAERADTQSLPIPPKARWLNSIGTRVYRLAQSVINSSPSAQPLDN